MLKIKIFSPGKVKESWLASALAEYEKRLTGQVAIEWDLKKFPSSSPYISLDPKGTELTSPELSKFLFKEWELQGSRLSIVIGGPDGIPEEILRNGSHRISLSKLTFTHQITRLLFLEQLYRAVQIEKGTDYHRD